MIEMFIKGGPVMYPLLLCSVISLSVIIERFIFWIGVDRARSRALLDEVLELCRQGDWEAVRLKAAGSGNYVIRVLISGILHRDYSLGKAMESASAEEIGRMGRFMGVLDTMITVAPLLGILGTVTGIIDSFNMLGAQGLEQPQAVTAGIAEALITTAAGLIIAIATLVPYNMFNARIERAARRIEKYATSFEIVYEKIVLARRTGDGGDL
ncbi:MAG: MotA/TolQ/ExbB proton channel family protein [Deltaproteobacteria bacterium]|nr:MotA/TolQ/ExbB proton channel family protein [Deltaproteobacteria bacterium]